MSTRREHEVVFTPEEGRCAVSGVLRLASVDAYAPVLAGVAEALRTWPRLTLDLRELAFLNSSGVRALARLVLAARDADRPLALVGTTRYPWQAKAAASLRAIHPGLVIELRLPVDEQEQR